MWQLTEQGSSDNFPDDFMVFKLEGGFVKGSFQDCVTVQLFDDFLQYDPDLEYHD